jgi:hypothetical protein
MEDYNPIEEDGGHRHSRLPLLQWPASPSWSDYFTFGPRMVINFLRRLAHCFGWRFVAVTFVVYGLQQGTGVRESCCIRGKLGIKVPT